MVLALKPASIEESVRQRGRSWTAWTREGVRHKHDSVGCCTCSSEDAEDCGSEGAEECASEGAEGVHQRGR